LVERSVSQIAVELEGIRLTGRVHNAALRTAHRRRRLLAGEPSNRVSICYTNDLLSFDHGCAAWLVLDGTQHRDAGAEAFDYIAAGTKSRFPQ